MSALLQRAEDIGLELSSRIGLITRTGGYETDIGGTVFRGRRKTDASMHPCAAIIEAEDEVEEQQGKTTAHFITQHYVVIGYTQCDPDNPNDAAHKMLRDMKRAIFTTNGANDATWGRKVRKVKYVERDIAPRADGSDSVAVAIHILVQYVEDVSNP